VHSDPLMFRSVLSALYWYLSGHSSRTRAITVVYGDIAIRGDKLGITPDTLDALAEAATPPIDGKFDQVLRAGTTLSLGYCKPWPGFEFGSDKAFGTMGAGGSLGCADPELGLGFGYVMNRMDFYLWDDPREHALRDAAST
jgi:CubicO group peptidase (beta-lactamase class C family)